MSDPFDPMLAVPVQPIAYSSPVQDVGRPGAITAIGIISVVIGSLSILTSGIFGLWSVGILVYANAQQTMSMATRSSNVVSHPTATGTTGDAGLAPDERRIVVDGMARVRPLTARRQQQLEELLAQNGKDLLVLRGDALTTERVAANVSDSGRLTAGGGRADGPDYYTLGEGRVEVSDDHASWFPNGGEAVRVSAPDAAVDGTTTAPATSLTAAQIQAVLRRVQSLGGQLNAAQRAALIQALSSPGEQFVVPTLDGSDPSTQVTTAATMANGVLFVSTSHKNTSSYLQLDKTGQVTSSVTSGAGPGGGFAFSSTSGGPVISTTGAMLVVLGCALSLALAVYLLICGILVLRHSSRGARLHLIYALLKIPVALLTAGAMAWVCYQFMKSTSMSNLFARAGLYLAIPAVLGCAYPVALLIVLRGRRVRDYYAGVR